MKGKSKHDVKTSYGIVRGFRSREDSTYTFRGIPYARAERFKAPRPPEKWNGVLDCARFGPICPQAQPLPDTMTEMMKRGASMIWNKISNTQRKLVVNPPKNASETEGLNLNVYSKDLDVSAPVLVWFHGGAFMFGSGSQPIYQSRWGSLLSKRTGCVLVTINYRLGAFGFMKVSGGASNCGIRDQIAALEWVKREIVNFGGNPLNVTIAGESAGGMSVGTLLASPLARPLFHKAIAMSGAADNAMSSSDAKQISNEFARLANLNGPVSVENAKNLSVAQILTAQTRLLVKMRMAMPFQPHVDGDVLTDFPLQSVRNGCAKDKNLMIGFNKSEWALFAPRIPVVSSWMQDGSPEILSERVARQLMTHRLGAQSNIEDARDLAHAMVTKLCNGLKNGLNDVIIQFYTELVFAAPAIRLAEAFSNHNKSSCHVYRFDFSDSVLSAAHAVELPLLFGTHNQHIALQLFSGSMWGRAELVSNDLMRSFESFMRHGTPGWASYRSEVEDRENRNVYIFGRDARVDKAAHKGYVISELRNVLEASKRPFGIRIVPHNTIKSKL